MNALCVLLRTQVFSTIIDKSNGVTLPYIYHQFTIALRKITYSNEKHLAHYARIIDRI